MSNVYNENVVAFVDILGFKESLKIEETGKKLLELLNGIKEGQSEKSKLDIDKMPNGNINIRRSLAVTAFSDSIILSCSSENSEEFDSVDVLANAVDTILCSISQLANFVIKNGYLLRGGITVGNLYHADGIVFGEALVEAYNLERCNAIMPRILASDKLVERYSPPSCYPSSLRKDDFNNQRDEEYYLDYLWRSFYDQPDKLEKEKLCSIYKETTEGNIIKFKSEIEHADNSKKLKKWEWFKKYINFCFDNLPSMSS